MSLPPLPPGFRLSRSDDAAPSRVLATSVLPTGEAHDGDTFRLNDGRNARLYGVDAFELSQQGRNSRGQSVALGVMAREKMGRLLSSGDANAIPTGAETYGRPVMSLTAGGQDAGKALLADGLGLVTPQYLRGDQPRLADYLETERQARLNRRGAFADTYDMPSSYRHGAPDPWAKPEPGKWGESTAVFFDDPTPFQGLRPELEKGYLGIWQDMSSTPDDLIQYAQKNGFGDRINPDEVRKQYEKRVKSQAPAGAMAYRDAPKLNIDPGDGKTGAALRGFGDVPTFGLLDELGGVVDALGGTAGRESLWNSDRRFGDILANNIGQNQAILRYDEKEHPWARFGGQVAGSLVPIGGAITSAGQAFRIGAAGGLAYGLGSSDADTVVGRIPDGLLGLTTGAVTGAVGQKLIDFALPKLNAAARKAIRARKGLDPSWGQFGPIHYDLAAPKKWDAAVKRMASDDAGEIPGAIKHPDAGNVDLIWGSGNYGVKHVAEAYPDTLADLPRRIEKMKVVERPDEAGGRWVLEDGDYRAVISPDAEGPTKRLVVSEFGPRNADGEAVPPLPEGFTLKEEGSPASSFVEGAITGGDKAPDGPDAPARTPDVLAMPTSRPRLDQTASIVPVDTARPVRPAPPARSLQDVQPEIDAWAARQGATPHADGDLPPVMLHGSPQPNIDEFDPYGRGGYGLFGAGTYLTDSAQIAAEYTGKGLSKAAKDAAVDRTMYAVRQAVKNPLDMDKAADRETWEKAAKRVIGDYGGRYFDGLPKGATNEQMFREVEDVLSSEGVTASEGRETMDALIRSLGHDGITHIGGGRVNKDGPRHRVVIALDPEQTEILDRLSVGKLMQPPGPRNPDWIDIGEVAPVGASVEGLRALDSRLPQQRQIDRIEVADRPRSLLDPVNDAERRAQAQRVEPSDVLPIPANTVDGVDEAASIERGRYEPVKAPDERDALSSRIYPSRRDGTRTIRKRGPADLVTWLRTQGGLRPEGGELQHFGIDNAPRKLDFAGNEQQLGRLVDPDNGMTYDEAAHRAWEAGFFPDHAERPTINEFLDALQATHSGGNRVFHPDDFAEVDDFLAQRQQRYAVESAKQEGAPLTNDRGEPIGLDDLDANAAPVTAYEEWGENAPNLAGNIRLDKLDSPQSIKRALASIERVTGGFDPARRGRIRAEETKALAADLNMTADDLLKRRKGQAFNAEEALAARQLLAKSGSELVTMAAKVRGPGNPGDEALAAFRQAWVRHVAIQEQVAGMTAEAGRVLSQFRIIADGRVPKGKVLPGLLSEAGGADRVQQAAEMILDNATDPAALNATAKRVLKPGWQDKLTELWYNSLLSGPQTHVVNIMSNTLTAAGQIPEHALAAGIGGLRRLVVPQAVADAVLFSEVGSRAVGMLQGAREGLREARRSLFTGNTSDAVTKLEDNQAMEAIPGLAGKIIRTPTRLLSAEDELFKATARRMELAGLATRMAGREGLKGAEARARAAELLANPTDEMLEKSFDYARYVTFQKPLGPVGRQVTAITQAMPLSKLVVPFVRTPTNLLKFALERSPGAPILKEWRDDMRAGGARRDLAAAKALLGSGLMAMVAESVAAGHLTGGGPADEDAKALLRADGWQPYSLRIGNKYYSYQRLDPISSTIGVAADWVDLQSHMTDKQRDDVATRLGVATLKNLSNKIWLSGISDLMEAINDPERSLKSYEARLAGSLAVPAAVAQIARTVDPVVRDAKEPLDRIRSRIPGLSSGILPKRDLLGRVVKSEGGVGPNIVSPVWTSTRAGDPTIQALLDAGAGISKPQKKIGDRILTPEEYDLYQDQTGRVAKPRLDEMVRRRAWLSLDPDGQQEAVRKVMKGAREEARATLFGAPVKKSKRPAASGDLPPLPPGFKMREVPPLPKGFRMVR